jgi:hypothetical protein
LLLLLQLTKNAASGKTAAVALTATDAAGTVESF